jgi:hypothetical protein
MAQWRDRVNQAQAKLNTLTYKPDVILNQRFLGELPLPQPGTISVVSSACKTGKSESLCGFVDPTETVQAGLFSGAETVVKTRTKLFRGLIEKHREAFPNAKLIKVTSRRGLSRQDAERLGITYIEDLRGKNGIISKSAVAKTREITLVIDSLDYIDIHSITPNSLLVLDEGEATLGHAIEGGTLKGKQAQKISHLDSVINRVLETGGSVELMEDQITNSAIDALKELTGNRYPVHITVNQFQPSHWDIKIGDGSKTGATKRILDCLRSGERLMVVTTSQRYAEELEWIALREPGTAKKIVRLDRLTAGERQDLIKNPNDWLKNERVDLLIATPIVEMGWNVSVDVFDRVMGIFPAGTTRQQIQMLERYRLDVPREIYCAEFGCVARMVR